MRRVAGEHQKEWIEGCKCGPTPMSNFDFASRLTEMVIIGNLPVRLGHEIVWDARRMRAKNCDSADSLIRREYRNTWSLVA